MSNDDLVPILKNEQISLRKVVIKNEEDEDEFYCPECQCTFLETGKNISIQHFYKCETCFPDSKIRLICAACAAKCHKGHLLIDAGVSSGFCDCAYGSAYGSHICNRLLSFNKKLNLVNLSKSRRDNFRFITRHVCWSAKGEIVEVIIKRLHQTNNLPVFEEEENEEQKSSTSCSNEEMTNCESQIDVALPMNHTSEESIKKFSKTSYGTRRISKSSSMFTNDDHYIQSAQRMNRKSLTPRRASRTWKRPDPPNDGRFVIFINPKKKKVTS